MSMTNCISDGGYDEVSFLRLHLTLNPSPEGEGLYSIPEGMVASFFGEV
jgi:hypothetical protein